MKPKFATLLMLTVIIALALSLALFACNNPPADSGTDTTDDNQTDISDKEDDACSHDLVFVEETEATCTADGNLSYYYCKLCNRYYLDVEATLETAYEDMVIKAVGHAYDKNDWVAPRDATCTDEGNVGYYYCGHCNTYFDEGNRPITDVFIAKLPHTYDCYHEPLAATCTTTGHLGYYYCTTCKCYYDADFNRFSDDALIVVASGHHYEDVTTAFNATCTTEGNYPYRYCNVCGLYFNEDYEIISREQVIIAPTGHTYGAFAEAVAPTCTEAGNIAYCRCTECGAYFDEDYNEIRREQTVIPAAKHDFDIYVSAAAPTCTEAGHVNYYHCRVCRRYFDIRAQLIGATLADTVIAPTGHTADAPVIENAVEATCTAAGSYDTVTYCATCHAELARRQTITPALQHDYVFDGFDWNGYTAAVRLVCTHDESHIATLAAAVTDEITKAATALTEGVRTYTAAYTDSAGIHTHSITAPIAALDYAPTFAGIMWGQDYTAKAVYTDTSADYTLYFAAEVTADVTKAPDCLTAGETVYTATYIESNNTVRTEAKTVVTPPLGHALTEIQATSPTCTEMGYGHHWYCATCGTRFDDSEGISTVDNAIVTIAPTGHTIVAADTLAPTCTATGTIAHYRCTVCDALFADASGTVALTPTDLTIAAAGHTVVAVDALAPTCTTEGHTVHYTCSTCNLLFADALGTAVITRDDTIIPATWHTITRHEAMAATCTTDGHNRYFTCSACGKYYADSRCTQEIQSSDAVLPAVGHALIVTPAVAATCTKEGNTLYYTCTRCGEHFADDAAAQTIDIADTVIAAFGHTFDTTDWTTPIEVTCTTDGRLGYYHCTVCLCYLAADGTTIGSDPSDLVVAATGHIFGDTIEGYEATCQATGLISYRKCLNCHQCFVLTDGAYVQTAEEDLVLPLREHKPDDSTVAINPTCTSSGNIAYYVCSMCNQYFADDKASQPVDRAEITLAALGHNYKDGTCTRCGESIGGLTINTHDGSYNLANEEGYEIYTVSAAGNYYISGQCADGQIYVNAGANDKVYLYLSGADITSSRDSVIYVAQAYRVYIIAISNTYNVLRDARIRGYDYPDAGAAAVYAACDIDITQDNGALSISGNYKYGIHTTKNLTVKKVNLRVTAPDDAIRADKSVQIASATVHAVSTQGVGIKTTDCTMSNEGLQSGAVTIDSSSLFIYTHDDGIDAAYDAVITSANSAIYIYTGNCATREIGEFTATGHTAEGIRAAHKIIINDAEITLNCLDTAIHAYAGGAFANAGDEASGAITVTNAIIKLRSAIDGMVADGTTHMVSGHITATTQRNGVVGASVQMDAGILQIYSAAGDGIVAATGDVTIAGGTTQIYTAYNGITAANNVALTSNMPNVYIYTGKYSRYCGVTAVSGDAIVGDVGNYAAASAMGIKAGKEIHIQTASLYINSSDDAIHADMATEGGNVIITEGNIVLYSDGNAIFADNDLRIDSGNIDILYAHNGLSGYQIHVNGGNINIHATEKDIVASGNGSPQIIITRGKIDITLSASNAIDATNNDTIRQSGGTIIMTAPVGETSGEAVGTDINGTWRMTEGNTYYITFSAKTSAFAAGTWYVKHGVNNLFGFTLDTCVRRLTIYSGEFVKGGTYTLTNGTVAYCWTMSGQTGIIE